MRTYIRCVKIHPDKRECWKCRHTCAIRGEKYIDPDLEKAEIELAEDQRDLMQVEVYEERSYNED